MPTADLEIRLHRWAAGTHPANLARYQPGGRPLAPIDVEGEWTRARTGLGTIPATRLPGPVTLNNLGDQLRQEYDVLYLACHGALVKGGPQLWLEDEAGQA